MSIKGILVILLFLSQRNGMLHYLPECKLKKTQCYIQSVLNNLFKTICKKKIQPSSTYLRLPFFLQLLTFLQIGSSLKADTSIIFFVF